MAHTTSYAPWPGRSDVAWATADDVFAAPWPQLGQCPGIPDVDTPEAFRRHVRIPFPEGCLLCAVLGGLVGVLLLTAVLPTPVEVQNPTWVIAIWSAAVLALVIALVGYVRGASALPFASRRAYSRMRARLHLLGRVYPARSSTGTEAFRIDAGGVWQDTSVVIDTALAADDAARLLRAFDLWFTVLENDALACRAAQLRFGSATIVTSEEIFGPGAVGGYLVLDQYSGTIGWRLLVAGRPLNPLVGPYRGGEIFAVADPRAPEEPQSCSISHADDSGHLLERVATAVALSAAVGGMLWFGWVITSGPW